MARLVLTLALEPELLDDAVRELEGVHLALARRHGAAFRALDRRIEKLVEDPAAAKPPLTALEPGRFVIGVPAPIADILAEARALGVRPEPVTGD